MIRIGIVGSDNTHAERFSELCNLEGFPGRVRGARVVSIYGRDPQRTAEVAEKGRIPRIVETPDEMLGQVDAVMVVFRHGALHCEHALPFLEAGVPTFVDKPFATTVRDARRMVGVSAGPGDVRSEYGGFIFYGIHAIEMMQETFGTGVRRVSAVHHAGNLVTTVQYRGEPIVSLQVLGNASSSFHVAAYGKGGADASVLDLADCYSAGLKVFLKMVRTGEEPIPHEHMVEAVAVAEAVEKSMRTGEPATLPRRML